MWEQTKTALLATDATASARPFSVMSMRFEQIDRGDGPRVRDVGILETDSAAAPWFAPAPRVKRDKGYVHALSPTRMRFWAPSIDVLVSSEFAQDHCGRLEDSSDGELLLLRFEPRRTRSNLIDIAGRIVVDRRTSELRELSFRYTNVDTAVIRSDVGGLMTFARFRDGSWMVSDWFIRVLIAHREADTIFARPFPMLAGVVVDSLTGRPVRNAQLLLRESLRQAITDSTGRFAIGRVRPGAHTLQINTPSLDSLGSASVIRLLVMDSTSASRVVVPTLRQALSTLCDRVRAVGSSAGFASSVIHGRVMPMPTETAVTTIFAHWTEPFTGALVRARAVADPSGEYRLCNVPAGIAIDLFAERGPLSTEPVRVQLDRASPFGLTHFVLEPRAEHESTVRAVVLERDGRSVRRSSRGIHSARYSDHDRRRRGLCVRAR